MTGKDHFKSSRERTTGKSTNEENQDIINDLKQSELDSLSEPKNHTLRLTNKVLERIKDYVYHRKCNGSPFYSQGELVEEAVEKFLNELSNDIPPRPEEVRQRERKRTGRKKGKSRIGNSIGY